jgi:hypothetical protein
MQEAARRGGDDDDDDDDEGRRPAMFWGAAEIRQAMNSTARFLPGYNASDQGHGLLDLERAWNLLEEGLEPINITSRVRVNTILSDFLEEPGFGKGIYDREGVTLGQRYTRTYTFTRTSGPNRPMNFHLRWVGNDGTFALTRNNLSLRLNVPTTLDVRVNPFSTGVHSAILKLDNSSTDGVDFTTMNTVLVPETFSAANGYSVTKTGVIGRNQAQHFFFRVPAGNPVLKIDLAGPTGDPGTGQVRFLRWHPWGLGLESSSSLSCYMPQVSPGGSCAGDPLSRSGPAAEGVWEVTVEARRTSDVAFAPFTLTASLFGVTVAPNPDVISTAQVGVPVARSYTMTNNFGAFTGRAVGSPLGSARRGVFTIGHHEVQDYVTVIPAGTTSFRATIGGPSDAAADLDLFVFRCAPDLTGCVLAGQNADGDSEESVTINNPVPATYVVEVDGFDVPAGTTTYNYIDIFANPALGSISITDADASRASGSSWTVAGSVLATQVPASGRVLYGNVQVRTAAPDNILVGQSDVIVQNVSP